MEEGYTVHMHGRKVSISPGKPRGEHRGPVCRGNGYRRVGLCARDSSATTLLPVCLVPLCRRLIPLRTRQSQREPSRYSLLINSVLLSFPLLRSQVQIFFVVDRRSSTMCPVGYTIAARPGNEFRVGVFPRPGIVLPLLIARNYWLAGVQVTRLDHLQSGGMALCVLAINSQLDEATFRWAALTADALFRLSPMTRITTQRRLTINLVVVRAKPIVHANTSALPNSRLAQPFNYRPSTIFLLTCCLNTGYLEYFRYLLISIPCLIIGTRDFCYFEYRCSVLENISTLVRDYVLVVASIWYSMFKYRYSLTEYWYLDVGIRQGCLISKYQYLVFENKYLLSDIWYLIIGLQ